MDLFAVELQVQALGGNPHDGGEVFITRIGVKNGEMLSDFELRVGRRDDTSPAVTEVAEAAKQGRIPIFAALYGEGGCSRERAAGFFTPIAWFRSHAQAN